MTGDELRAAITAAFEVDTVDGRALLDLMCRTADEVAQLEAAIDEHGPVIPGARGQLVRNPALDAVVKHRRLLADLIARGFPEAKGETKSQKAARAARTRWDRQREGAA